MAIVNSLAIGKSVKSAGNLTYKTVRGRTIASQRITENKSNTFAQSVQRGLFGTSNKAMQLVLPWINNAFEKSKYGSSRNAFLSECKAFDMGNLLGEILEGSIPLWEAFLIGVGTDSNGKQNMYTQYYMSRGSAPIVVSADIVIANIDSPSGGGLLYYKSYQKATFIFTSPIAENKAELLLIGFFKDGATNLNGKTIEVRKFDLTDESIASIETLGMTITKTSTNGLVSSITCTVSASVSDDADGSIYFPLPRISGKVPTTMGVFNIDKQPLP